MCCLGEGLRRGANLPTRLLPACGGDEKGDRFLQYSLALPIFG